MRRICAHRDRIIAGLAALIALAIACSDDALPPLRLEPILAGRAFELPVEIAQYSDDRLLVAERPGRVLLVNEAETHGTVLLDITQQVDHEAGEGLLSFAIDPSFSETGHVWAYYFASPPRPSFTRLSRFTVVNDAADPSSELVVLELEQPGFNQNGGAIRFGPADDMLYLSLGDGSASMDPFLNGQDKTTLLGSMIRIDVREATAAAPYRIPTDNPFIDDPGARPELFAYGLRNPFRMSIDPEGGQIWVGDVQMSGEEEINVIEPGSNHGWNVMEGNHCLGFECDESGLTLPVFTYLHSEERCAVIGGLVYRGKAVPALRGHYLFGDFCSGEVWAFDRDGDSAAVVIAELNGNIVSFGTDEQGEVLVLDHAGGGAFRLVEGSP